MFGIVNSQIFAFLCGFFLLCNVYEIVGQSPADSWLMFARQAKKVFNKCYKNHTEPSESWTCLKYNSLLLFDDITAADTIPITDAVELIRRPIEYGENQTYVDHYQLPARRYDGDDSEFSWIEEIKKRAIRTLSTHNIRFALQHPEASEARHKKRHKKFRMFPAMIFGMAILGVIIIPIGFHIMAVIGGISLLFGKMALLLATITGFRRLAAPGVPFG